MIDAELDRPAEHPDGPAAGTGSGAGVEGPAGLRQAHRAEPHPVDGQVTELPGARGCRGFGARSTNPMVDATAINASTPAATGQATRSRQLLAGGAEVVASTPDGAASASSISIRTSATSWKR